MLERVKRRHRAEFGYGDDEDNILDKLKRKAREPSPEPGRVV